MLDRLVYKFFAGLDNIILSIDNWCYERYKTITDFFNRKDCKRPRKTKRTTTL